MRRCKRTPNYGSALAPYFKRFIALKRASGAVYNTLANWLAHFDRYLKAHWSGQCPLDEIMIQEYFGSFTHLAPNSRRNPVSVAWQALSHALRHDAPIDSVPPRPSFRRAPKRIRDRYVFSVEEVARLLTACRQLNPACSLRSHTSETLLGLLYCTGIRVGEALGLDVGDIDFVERLLLIRSGKFGKDRLLPLHPSTVDALLDYLQSPRRPASDKASDPLFVSCRRTRLSYSAIRTAYRWVLDRCKIRDEAGRLPRIHDLRFTFAAHRLAAWYRAGRDVNRMLPALSTYLGHVDVNHTVMYLRPAAPFLQDAAARFETACAPVLKEVRQ